MVHGVRTLHRGKRLAIVLIAGFCALAPLAHAATYKLEEVVVPKFVQDFVVGPTKVDLTLRPGESRTVNLIITNRMGDTRDFLLEIEDFTGSQTTDKTVELLGAKRGPYSLRDWISFREPRFELAQGYRATVPVTISVPYDADPGGRYGSVLVSTVTKKADTEARDVAGGAAIVSRVGVLFFIRIPGDVNEAGELERFGVKGDQTFFTAGPIRFEYLFRNTGSVHLNPYGEIRITNLFGQEVDFIEVEPWFAMPQSLRLREVSWDRSYLLGRYVAETRINRGYDDIIDEDRVVFYVFPLHIILSVLGVIVLLLFIIKFIGSRFEIRIKTK